MTTFKRIKIQYIRVLTVLIVFLTVFSNFSSITVFAEEDYGYEADVISAIVVNETRDKVLYEKEADKQIYPASTTKVLMALVVASSIEEGDYSLDDTFAAYDELYFDIPWDGSTANIQPGEVMTVRDFLYCALMVSANEACNALAVNDSGSVDAFVEKMNEKAAELGCESSHFSDTHGIYHDDHYTTARDMYRIFSAVMNDPILSEIITTPEYVVPENNKSEERELYNTNMLIDSEGPLYYEYALGGKTGYTEEAGCCLVSAAEKDDERLICIVMGADFADLEDGRRVPGSFVEAKELYEWCYSEYGDQPLIDPTQPVASLPVRYGKDVHSVDVIPKEGTYVYMRKSEAETWVTYEVKFKKDTLNAPVRAGEKVGTIEAVYNGELIGSSKLIAAEGVKFSIRQMFKESTLMKLLVFSTIVLVLTVLFRIILFRRK
ncbi:MAG: D-alanyl-D-alanine carboxypeptidase [Firmicutes bacterium]|nr:D-alanyl-D-alanine carboxypeptidase [Bacillota bacterium]